MKNKKLILISLSVILVFVIIIACVITLKPDKKKKTQPVTVVDRLEDYGYELTDNSTDYMKVLFNNLKNVLNQTDINEEEYAKVVSQLFITDFYTLSNKMSKNDVGGIQFVYKEYWNDFEMQAQKSVYSSVISNIYGDRKQELPVVTKVSVDSITNKPFEYLEKSDDNAFNVALSIEYEVDMEYPKKCELIVIHNDNKLEIAKMD